MTNVSLGTGRQRKTHHISYSCGHTAGFLVVLGVSLLRCHAFAFFQFFFFLVCSGGAIVYPELDGVIEICVGFFFLHIHDLKLWTASPQSESYGNILFWYTNTKIRFQWC